MKAWLRSGWLSQLASWLLSAKRQPENSRQLALS